MQASFSCGRNHGRKRFRAILSVRRDLCDLGPWRENSREFFLKAQRRRDHRCHPIA